MTGQGGWPMTVFTTPDGRAVLLRHLLPAAPARHAVVPAGARRGREAWAERRDEVAAGRAADRRGALGRRAGAGPGAAGPRTLLDDAAAALLGRRTTRRTAASAARRSSRRRWCWSSCCATTPAPATRRCDMVARHRARRWPAAASTTSSPAASPATPSTPAGWCRTSRRCSTTTRCCCGSTCTCGGRPATALARRVADETADFLLARPADARGRVRLRAGRGHRRRRGPDLRLDAGPADRGARARRRRVGRASCSRSPTAARSSTAPRRCSCVRDPDDAAAAGRRCGPRLLAARAQRPQPARDDKVVTAWNGLAIAGAGRGRRAARRRRPRWRPRPTAAELLLGTHLVDGRLRRASRDGVAGAPRRGARGLRRPGRGAARAAPGDRARRAGWTLAGRPAGRRARRSSPTATGGFYDTADDAETLVHRP